jgi:hypothetical protein
MIEKDWNEMFVEEMSQSIKNGLETMPRNNTELAIQNECNRIAELLIQKNRAYGNSALEPVRIFSSSDNIEQLKVRIDDKLSRFVRGTEFLGDNDIDDLMGYLVLLNIAQKETWK